MKLFSKLQNTVKPLRHIGWLGILVIIILLIPALNLVVLSHHLDLPEDYGIIGGPETSAPIFDSINEATAISRPTPEVENSVGYEDPGTIGFLVADSNSFVSIGSPIFNSIPTRDGTIIYRIQEGDNLSSVAARFGISLNTLYWSNDIASSIIQPGDELVILPVSGVQHEVQDGDTIASIAEKYSADENAISSFNDLGGVLQPGTIIIVPNGILGNKRYLAKPSSRLPSYSGYYIMPTTGWNWGRLHYNNAVDIANACGTEIYASAEGLVIDVVESGWNQGYGKMIKIEHPNGTKTLYAHIQSSEVSIGNFVERGELIAYLGNTGKTHGPTGCHLHFEVQGAKNPLAK